MTTNMIPELANTTISDLRLTVSIAPGADLNDDPDLWTFFDITEDVMFKDNVTISIGRADEQSQAQPASCTFTLLNDSGDYTPRRPGGAYFPDMRLGFPVKVVATSTVTGAKEQFSGYVDEIVPGWDTTGKVPVVTMTAKGPIQRIQQGDAPRTATVNRAALDQSLRADVAAYWPMDENGDDITRTFASGIGGSPLNITGTDGMNFATFDGIPGSNPLPTFKAGTNINGPVATSPSTSGAVFFRCFLNAATVLSAGTVMIRLAFDDGGTIRVGRLLYQAGGGDLEFKVDNAADSEIFTTGTTNYNIDGRPFYLSIELTDNGTDVDWLTSITKINTDGTTTGLLASGTWASTSVGNCTRVDMGGSGTMTDWAVGHVGVANTQDWLFANSDLLTGYRGEYVDERVTRLSQQAGVPVTVVNIGDTFMGSEGTGTYMDAMRECELANDAVLYDGVDFGLVFRCRRTKQNKAVDMALDIRDGDVMPPFEPVENTQKTRNSITVTRKGGSSATAVQPAGYPYSVETVGVFEDSLTVNIDDDVDLPGQAHWRLHLGTIDLDRYPNLNLNFRASPRLALLWLNSGGIGARITVTGLPLTGGYDPDLFVEGYTMTIGPLEWSISLNCSPAQPYDVAVVDATTYRVSSGGAVLASAAAAGATSITVDSPPPRRFGTSAGSFYLAVGGYKVLCTAISGAGTTQTFTISSLPGAVPAGAEVQVWYPLIVSLEGANT